ncbi:hypothetical protein SELMODRAFT_19115, partial [Selaginella moellendorffii]
NYSLHMQLDCNLVLYSGKTVVWTTNTDNLEDMCFLRIQNDENLVMYDKHFNVIWSYNIYWINKWHVLRIMDILLFII